MIKQIVNIKRILLTIILFAVVIPLIAGQLSYNAEKNDLKNSYFTIRFDTQTGLLSIYRKTGQPLISGAFTAINLKMGRRISKASDYAYAKKTVSINNEIGSGSMLKIQGRDREKKLDIEIQIALYDNLNAVIFETIIKNVSSNEIVVNSIEPLRVLKTEAGSLFYPNVSECLTNGAMYFDAGTIHTFGKPFKKHEPYGEAKGRVMSDNSLSANDQTVQSWWNVGLFSGYDRQGISLGYIENKVGLGRIQLLKTDSDQLSFIAESVYDPGFVLKQTD